MNVSTFTKPLPIFELSDDTLMLLATSYGMTSELKFGLKESRPAPRTQAALDELVKHGIFTFQPFNEYGGWVYTRDRRYDVQEARVWYSKLTRTPGEIMPDRLLDGGDLNWVMYQPIDEAEMVSLMTPYGQGVWAKERTAQTPKHNPFDVVTDETSHKSWLRGYRHGTRSKS